MRRDSARYCDGPVLHGTLPPGRLRNAESNNAGAAAGVRRGAGGGVGASQRRANTALKLCRQLVI